MGFGQNLGWEVEIIRNSISFAIVVDGRWSDWQAWEPCSVSCGFGVQLRTRYCNNPAPVNGGKMCEGDLVESSPCEAKPCRKY